MKRFLSVILMLMICFAHSHLQAQCAFTVTATVTNVVCYNGTTGGITVAVAGGTSPYQYQLAEAGAGAWQPGNTFTSLAAATYPVSVKDATGCIKTIYTTVSQPTALSASYTSTNPTCSGSTNGSITIAPTGGTAPYTYNWTKDGSAYSTSQNLSGLSLGNYLLVLTDNKGCFTSPVIAQQIKTVGLTGFNEDVIADGNTVAASSASTQAMDQSPGNILYASGYKNSSGVLGTGGLPASGNFSSTQSAARLYQLASYSSSNALLLRSSTDNLNGGATSGTLTFLSQYKSPYATLYVVGTTGAGTGTVNYTVNYTDGTSMTASSMTFPDWSLAAATPSSIRALGSLDRVTRTSPGSFASSTSFNLFEAPIIVGNQTKSVKSVDFSWYSASTARINLFAITGYTATGNGIRINDGPSSGAAPSVTVAPDSISTPFCAGQSVVMTAMPVNGGSSPSYQWYKNASPVGTNSPTYTNGSLANNDQITVVMTANGGVSCLSSLTASGNTVILAQAPKAAAVSVATTSSGVCSGQPVAFNAVPINGGNTPTYLWNLNGLPTGITTASYTNSALVTGDQVSVTMTSSISCVTGIPTSIPITMTVNANGTPSSVVTGSLPAVTFSSSNLFAGSSPVYQWFRNGLPISGANSSTYYNPAATIGEQYSLKVSSNYACALQPAAMSNYLTVNAALLPVTLVSFQALVRIDKVELNWTTSYEAGNKQFIVQRASSNNLSFETIGTVQSAHKIDGSSYTYADNPQVAGKYYYRLVQEDLDGRQVISHTVSVELGSGKGWWVANGGNAWNLYLNGTASYVLADVSGKVISAGVVNGVTSVRKPGAKGIYILKVIKDGMSSSQELLK